MKENLLIIHGGAPTAVMNASLYGVITEAKKAGCFEHIYAAIGGTGGILREEFMDLLTLDERLLSLLPCSPASAIGTSRDVLNGDDYNKIAEILKKLKIRYVFVNGGNGSMDTCGKIYRACREIGSDIRVIGIPKTIDNDISVTDHSPGYGSAARFIAGTVSEIAQDIYALPIHVSVIEAMGRNAGWIAAASALAKRKGISIPDLIYFPERSFDMNEFLSDIEKTWKEKKGVIVVASEGLKDNKRNPIVPPIMTVGRATYYGDVSAHLANMITKELGIKARSEKPGIGGRASFAFQSVTDRNEAVLVGREAVIAALEGKNGIMIGLERASGTAYDVRIIDIPIEKVMLIERVLPAEYINEKGNGVTEAFIEWCEPLIGEPLPEFVSFS